MDYSNYGVEGSLRMLFKRCVACPDATPTCPTCADDEYCSQVSQTCSTCASRTCLKISDSGAINTGSNGPSTGGPNIGAIAGGVVGGLAVIALVTYLIWRFGIKNKRREKAGDNISPEKPESTYSQNPARASTHTVASMASTVMTRASNVIQIAFIPGITDRTNDHEGNPAVPPVPSIPLQHQPNPQMSPYLDSPHDSPRAHYFMPRDSTYSGYSDGSSIRQSVAPSISPSLARQSVTPSLARQSYASTIFHQDNAVAITPAQTAFRGRANMVSVKPGQGSSPGGSSIPEMPQVDYFKYGQQVQQEKQRNQSGLKRQPSMAPSIAPSLAPSIAASDTASVRNMIATSASAAAAGYPPNPPLSIEDKRKTSESTRIAAALSAAQRTNSMQPPPIQQYRSSGLSRASESQQTPAQQPSPSPRRTSPELQPHKDPSPFSDENAAKTP